jgi:predicted HAD superfamily phosphohydrolase
MSVATERPELARHPTVRIRTADSAADSHRAIKLFDFEGPIGIVDGALEVTDRRVGPEDRNDTHYGRTIYLEGHSAFMHHVIAKGKGQIGHDVIFPLPSLLYHGVTNQDISNLVTDLFKRTPGSPEHIAHLKNRHQAHTVTITTAYEQAHTELALGQVGLDDIVATDFPIDRIREDLQKSGRFDTEMAMTGAWLKDCYLLISKRENSGNDREKATLTRRLRSRIMHFFTEELGLTWNEEGQMAPYQGKFRTQLGEAMAGLYVVGDREKANVVRRYSKPGLVQEGGPRPSYIADGVNDVLALQAAEWSIGLNGSDAAKAAKIGVAAMNIGPVLIALDDAIAHYINPTPENVEAVINQTQEVIGKGTALIHKGGPDMSTEHSGIHSEMKEAVRGPNGSIVDNLHIPKIS